VSVIASDLVAYLDAQLAETSGTDLFEGPIGETPDNQIAVTDYASEESEDYVMGPSLTEPGYEPVRVQVVARHTVKATAASRARAAYGVLRNLQNHTGASGARYLHVIGHGRPFFLKMDQGAPGTGRWTYAFSITAKVAGA
jgi:hypothetical protein